MLCHNMQRATKKPEDLTVEEVSDIKQFDIDKANGKTKVSTLEELIKELHE